jgi:hypothetical protein
MKNRILIGKYVMPLVYVVTGLILIVGITGLAIKALSFQALGLLK